MFKNLVTLVTGGASGLGKATVNRFANKGARVIFCDLPTSKGEEVAKEIGNDVKYVPANVTKEEDVKNVLEEIKKNYGKLDVLVNCAGLLKAHVTYNFSEKRPRNLEDFVAVIQANVIGTYNVNRLAVEIIGQNAPDENDLRGVIINTAGVEGIRGTLGQVSTAAASGAIIGMTRPLAKDFGTQGIRVVTIAPGLIKTPVIDYFPKDTEDAISQECIIAPNRFGEPDEFAHLVQSIVVNPYINGTTIELSAGLNITF